MLKTKIIHRLYHNSFVARIFHTLVWELSYSLRDSYSVLDIGCGPSSPLQHVKHIRHSVGIEAFKPYLEQSKLAEIHSEYFSLNALDADFPPNSFDAVMLIEVIEHLSEKDGFELLKRAEIWARKKVIVSTPNGFVPQHEVDNNPLQKHLSGWTVSAMEKLGYKCWGLAGLKWLRQEVSADTMGDDLTTSIRYKPRFFWFVIAALSQPILYFFPKLAFELFCIKSLKKPSL